jgi:hypothetical protein
MGKVHAFRDVSFLGRLVWVALCQILYPLMERFSWSVRFEMETSENRVQSMRKKRSQSDKIGRLKYNQQLLKQALAEIAEVKLMLRTIFAGLKGSFNFDQSLIERVACHDEVDREILNLLFEAGSPGLLPKDLATKLERFKITRHQISRRVHRMNRRLQKEFGEHAAEKRGWHWALTGFVVESWGETESKNATNMKMAFPDGF